MITCPVLQQLTSCVTATAALPVPNGLGAGPVLAEQMQAIASAVAALERELALRMAALEREAPRSDPRGYVTGLGVGSARAAQLRSLGQFTHTHPALQELWSGGSITVDQVAAVQAGSAKLPTPLKVQLVQLVAEHLPSLDVRGTRQLVAAVADQLMPGDPDLDEQSEQQARKLTWTDTPRGGMAFQGYLPAAQADHLRAAICARAEQLRAQGDGLTMGQRFADALTALVAEANTNEPHRGGGLPAALTLTVSLTEAERISAREPAHFGTLFQARPHGDARIDGKPAGDAAIRFGLCCAAITPVLHRDRHGTSTGAAEPARGSLIDSIARTTSEPLAVGRAVRLATPAQRQALRIRDRGCVIPGCDVKAAYTEPHHVIGWALGGRSDLDNLVSVCFVHHLQTEVGRYTFTRKQSGQPAPEGAHEHHYWWISPPGR